MLHESVNQLKIIVFAVAATATLSGCATLVPPRPAEPAPVAECRAYFADIDRRTDRAGVRDAGSFRIDGFPYLRVNRFYASFSDELSAPARFNAWTQGLARLDREARMAELRNQQRGQDARWVDQAILQLDRCRETLSNHDLSGPAGQKRLIAAIHVPSDYSVAQRVFGLYPLAVPFLKRSVTKYQNGVLADYAKPLTSLDSPGPLVLWRSETGPTQHPLAKSAVRDALGVPQLTPEQWQSLAAAHAPSWWVETKADYDAPGAPQITANGPSVDGTRALVYFRGDYTRFGSDVLPQISYIIWFSERPPEKKIDPYAGKLDGVIWRVTLDRSGKPLFYDTIHSCGCYRYNFPARSLALKERDERFREPYLFPQAPPIATRPVLRIQSGTQYLRRVVDEADTKAAESRSYRLAPYTELLSLPSGDGTRSLYGRCGLVAGSDRPEQLFLWPSGVIHPGAMRAWGRHATAFIGEAHFDDPRYLEEILQ